MKNLLRGLFMVYFILAAVVFTPYYNWQFAKNHGFVSWLLLGQIVPTGKALAWPYFVMKDSENQSTKTLISANFINSLNYTNELALITRKSEIGENDVKKIHLLLVQAFKEGKLVDIAILNKTYSGLGTNYRDNYLYGVSQMIKFFEENDKEAFENGQIALERWDKWYQQNSDAIRKS